MVIKNKTTGKILATDAIKAETYFQKTFGLIFSKPKTMIFRTRFGIHTFFMRYPIDVLVLDKENKVAAIKENLKPNRIFLWNIKHEILIEFPPETLPQTKIGDQISFNK